MGRNVTPGLRPFLPSDGAVLAEIFRVAIDELAVDDYDDAQRDAWISMADDEEAFVARLAGALTLVALVDGQPAGFASLKGADHIDMLFVHPAAANQGVGRALLQALETLARARGARHLTTDASDVANHLFAQLGYEPQRRETVERNGVWLARTHMRKTFDDKPGQPATGGGAQAPERLQ